MSDVMSHKLIYSSDLPAVPKYEPMLRKSSQEATPLKLSAV
jgi:hypothetical protein